MRKKKALLNLRIKPNGNTIYGQKKTEVPPELLSKEFLKQSKTEEDVCKFLKDLHSQVLEQML